MKWMWSTVCYFFSANPGKPFKSVVSVGDRKFGSGVGRSKEEAQNSAARVGLATLAPRVENVKNKLQNNEQLPEGVELSVRSTSVFDIIYIRVGKNLCVFLSFSHCGFEFLFLN